MTNHIDRAAEIIHQHHDNCTDAAAHLDLVGLVTRDLPRPDRDGRWWPTAASIGSVNISPAGEIVLHSGNFRDMTLHLTPAKARDLADILNAAANHSEGVGRADA